MNYKDLTGQTIGYLYVVKDSGKRRRGLVVWTCACLYNGVGCKRATEVVSEQFRSGTISCGCYGREQTRLRALKGYK